MDTKEILAVMCHELGHWFYNHTMVMLIFGLVKILILERNFYDFLFVLIF